MSHNSKHKPNHGDYKEYKYYSCRCARCKRAIADYVAKYRAKGIKGKHLTHGTRSSYNNGCRCLSCRDANRAYGQEWAARSRKKVSESS